MLYALFQLFVVTYSTVSSVVGSTVCGGVCYCFNLFGGPVFSTSAVSAVACGDVFDVFTFVGRAVFVGSTVVCGGVFALSALVGGAVFVISLLFAVTCLLC